MKKQHFDLPVYHPFRLLSILVMWGHTFLAPVLYFQIFNYRKSVDKKIDNALSPSAVSRRQKRNLVSAKINFLVWCSEATVLLTLIPAENDFTVAYLVFNTGLTPLFYYLGISTEPQ